MNRWRIPNEVAVRIRKRDKSCVYCGVLLKRYPHKIGALKNKATWEHINNDEHDLRESNIVMCCGACNSSKGAKQLLEWFESAYCKKKKINKKSVSVVIRKWLKDSGKATNKVDALGRARPKG